jgi:hypothetical protein
VCVDLGAAVLKKLTSVFEMRCHVGYITVRSSLGSSGQTAANAGSILMQHEYGKDIAKDHPDENHSDARKRQKPPRAQ